jgi:protein tyrosine/serine phosphatase
MEARQLVWDGCVNVRDLGGLATEHGRATAYGAVVRADDLTGLSESGWETLQAYGVRRIVDLRWPHEVAEQPPHRAEIEVVHVSLFGDEWDGLDRDRRFADIADYAERRQALYLDRLERYRARFAEAVTAVAHAPEGGVAVHCVAGVDRTGLVSALLLRLAGVDPDAIADDYGRSEPSWAPRVAVWMTEAADDEERAARRFLATVPAAAMSGVLRALESRYGDIAGYLRESGLDEDDLRAARRRLLP